MRLAAVAAMTLLGLSTPVRAQSADFIGATLADFMRARSDLFYVDARDVERRRIFLFAGTPQTVTTWLPPYVPTLRNPVGSNFDRAVNNLGNAFGTVPGVARTQTIQCHLYVFAERIPKDGRTKSTADWRIIQTEPHGPC